MLKVLDFGIVSEPSQPDEPRLTAVDAITGTPTYISPEAAVADREISGKSDMYSLGCVGYWLLTGKHVFEAPTRMAVIMQHVSDTPVPPSQRVSFAIPEDLEVLIMACLAKDVDSRPSALKLWSDLVETGLPQRWNTWAAADWWAENM